MSSDRRAEGTLQRGGDVPGLACAANTAGFDANADSIRRQHEALMDEREPVAATASRRHGVQESSITARPQDGALVWIQNENQNPAQSYRAQGCERGVWVGRVSWHAPVTGRLAISRGSPASRARSESSTGGAGIEQQARQPRPGRPEPDGVLAPRG
jgi:hypothetical protein